MKKVVGPILAVLLALGVLAGLSANTALAANSPGSNPATAPYIDNETHTIPGKTTQYYRFEYNGDNSPVQINLVNGANGPVAFNVFTPEQINESQWWLFPPIGRGTAPGCGSEGNCTPFASDLSWVGRFYAPGTYYVEVQNFDEQPRDFTLNIRGVSVRLCAVSPQPCPPMKLIPNV
jgi:hypothetical protein